MECRGDPNPEHSLGEWDYHGSGSNAIRRSDLRRYLEVILVGSEKTRPEMQVFRGTRKGGAAKMRPHEGESYALKFEGGRMQGVVRSPRL